MFASPWARLVGVVAPRRWGLMGFGAATLGSSLFAGALLAIVIAWRGVDAVPAGAVGITFDAYGWAAGGVCGGIVSGSIT